MLCLPSLREPLALICALTLTPNRVIVIYSNTFRFSYRESANKPTLQFGAIVSL